MTKTNFDLNRRGFLRFAGSTLAVAGATGLMSVRAMAQAAKGGVLRVSIQNRPKELSPYNSLNHTGYLIAELLYSGITRINEKLEAEPDLAESWSANDDATEFTFKLRPGVTFHSGAPLTAKDVKASIEAVLDPANGSGSSKTIGPIKSVEAIDDLTVKIVNEFPYADLPITLGDPRMKVVSAAVLEAEGVEGTYAKADGTGPFRLGDVDLDRKIEFLPNEAYWEGGDYPRVDAVHLLHYPDLNAEQLAFQNKEVDAMLIVDNANFGLLEQNPEIDARRQSTARWFGLTLRFDREPFGDLRVRQALRYSIDREAMVAIVLDGYGRVAYDNVISEDYPFYHQPEKPSRDIERAKALLAEAGHADGISFTLYVPDRPAERMKVALAFQQMAKPAGFDIEVRRVPYDEYLEKVWKKETAYIAGWSMKPTMDAYYTSLMVSDAPWEDTGWHNAEFDALVKEAQSTLDVEKRRDLFHKLQELTNEHVPYIIPLYQDYLAANWDYVKDYAMHPLQYSHKLERTSLSEDAPSR